VEIIGKGFLSGHLEAAFGQRYPDTTVLAAGVTKTGSASIADFDREAALVHEAARRCARTGRTLVFFSTASDSMYGAEGCSGTEDGPVYPISAYGRHKLSLEATLASSGADWLALRLSHIVGEGQRPHQLIPSLTAQVRSGMVRVHRDAHRDLLDVRHMIKAVDGLLALGVRQQVVNVASGTLEPIEWLVDGIERRLGLYADRTFVDVKVTTTRTSTARLCSLVPEWNDLGFGPGYLDQLLDDYVAPLRAHAEPTRAR
jgi:nucleoside-diphosphate-sugar epimerase